MKLKSFILSNIFQQSLSRHSVDHFKIIAMIFGHMFPMSFSKKCCKTKISICKVFLPSLLKHSVDHLEDIRMIFGHFFFQYFLVEKNVAKQRFLSVKSLHHPIHYLSFSPGKQSSSMRKGQSICIYIYKHPKVDRIQFCSFFFLNPGFLTPILNYIFGPHR